ncbi:PQQ-like beta-propeller repeat protein [Actinoplanes bogorensis]|uniref:PQQ-like beta-propeller repeat protein n=1 Tax=Paractinoplanes bogorensis TaxID=1610840 RepID=A0ABS5Z4S5_9ACTN|nr:PQQ-binding-like beta-propeller repeat protein [Actinoplanes bogorensis]MBU2670676.1 PQQ-like beta-propeller repeat protein [Actinoplanes bogorensis]
MLIDLDVAPPSREPVRAVRSAGYAVVALLVLALLVLGGSAAPARGSGLVQVLKADGQGLSASLLTTESVYVARSDGLVEATPLCPGCPAWSTQTTAGQRLQPGGDGTLVLDANETGVATFLDARTGAVLWSQNGFPVVHLIGGRVADWHPDDGALRLRDPRTGRLFWKRPAEAFVGDENRIVLINDARAAVYAAGDGREITGPRGLDVPGNPDFAAPGWSALMVGERLIVFGGGHVAAFRADGLVREWLISLSPYAVAGCGIGLLCTVGVQGVTVLDLATGRTRWTGPQWQVVTEDGMLTDEAGRSARVDLATGRIEHDFGRGRPADGLVLYPEGDRTTLVGAADGRVRGVIPRVTPDACSRAGDLFACLRYDSTVTVWRLGRPG